MSWVVKQLSNIFLHLTGNTELFLKFCGDQNIGSSCRFSLLRYRQVKDLLAAREKERVKHVKNPGPWGYRLYR